MKYVNYKIKNIEPIKLTSTIMQGDNEFTKSYISGSNLRGAFIANYISKNKVRDINIGEHKEKLLKNNLKFLNAYPIYLNEKTLPMPRCYYANKDDIKTLAVQKDIDISLLNEISNKTGTFDKIKNFDFARWNKDAKEFNPISLEKVGSLHIKKGFNEDNKLFRYEAIKEGQTFKGSVVCKDEVLAKEVKEVLEKGMFYIGGSKGSGYGLCEVFDIKIEDTIDEIKLVSESFKNEFVVILLSDMAYRDTNGEYKSFIPEKVFEKELEISNVCLKESFIESDYLTGYNNKWGYRIPNVLGLKKGSVLTYSFDGSLSREKVLELVDKGLGIRKNEGFGRILILDSLDYKKICVPTLKKSKEAIKLNKEEVNQLQLIVDRIYKEKLKNELSKKVLELNSILSGKSKIKQAQWGKLYRMMFLLEGMDMQSGISKLDDYFENINKKKLNRELANAFNHIKVDNQKLQEYILKNLKTLDEKEFYKAYVSKVKIETVSSRISKEEIYKYKLKVFKEFFRLQLKESERGK